MLLTLNNKSDTWQREVIRKLKMDPLIELNPLQQKLVLLKLKEDMKEEGNLSKSLYKTVLYLIKIIPIVISGIYLLNTVLSYFGIDLELFSYIVQFLFIGMIYATSYAFKFCAWHRMFIHYILIIFILNIVDYHIGIPLSDRGMITLYIIIATICLFLALYLKFKICKH